MVRHSKLSLKKRIPLTLFDYSPFNDMGFILGPKVDEKYLNPDEFRVMPINTKFISGYESLNKTTQIVSRKYPFTHLELPLLPDCDKFYSGKYGEIFWHQDADNVYIFYPIDYESLSKHDISVKFDVENISISIRGENMLSFKCFDRITPSSVWSVEKDKDGKAYLFIDLEKRFRFISWKGLFERLPETEEDRREEKRRILEKLYNANKGLVKLAGGEGTPASIEEMMRDPKLMSSIGEKISTEPRPIPEDKLPPEIKAQLDTPIKLPFAEIREGKEKVGDEEEQVHVTEMREEYQYDPEELLEVPDIPPIGSQPNDQEPSSV